jgi:hypothetical protein
MHFAGHVNTIRSTPPDASEHAPYYSRYTCLVRKGDIVETLERQYPETVALLSPLSDVEASYRYAPDKWSIKEVLGHVTDTERIFAYRALRIARNDQTPIEGFEQDDYVRAANFSDCHFEKMLEEFTWVRRASLLLFQQLSPEAWLRTGTASQLAVSVRALAYILAGHELHHRTVLKEKYLPRA